MHPVARIAEEFLAAIPAPRIVPTARGPMACAILGEGRPLLALHGVMGGLDQSWLLAHAVLSRPKDWQIIAVARPGYPGTPLDSGRTAEEQAEAYAALLDALGLPAAHVVGFSGAGPSVLAFGRLHRERCRGLMLVSACTGHLATEPSTRAGLAHAGLLAHVPGMDHAPAWLVRHWPQMAARTFVPDDRQRMNVFADPEAGPLLTALLLSSCRHIPDRLPGTLNDISEFERLPPRCDARTELPLLAVHGTDDGIVPFAHGVELASHAPDARFLALPGATHMALFTHLAAVRREAARLLDANG